jgi:hypothetical protein
MPASDDRRLIYPADQLTGFPDFFTAATIYTQKFEIDAALLASFGSEATKIENNQGDGEGGKR